MSESEKTHVLTMDCILSECGICKAGTMLSESDVIPSTWGWLQASNYLKSVADIEAEADASDTSEQDSTEPQAPEVKKTTTGKGRK